jgi:hypothetical protein
LWWLMLRRCLLRGRVPVLLKIAAAMTNPATPR